MKVTADEDIFDKLNSKVHDNPEFDNHFQDRRYFSKILKKMMKAVSYTDLYKVLSLKVEALIEKVKTDNEDI